MTNRIDDFLPEGAGNDGADALRHNPNLWGQRKTEESSLRESAMREKEGVTEHTKFGSLFVGGSILSIAITISGVVYMIFNPDEKKSLVQALRVHPSFGASVKYDKTRPDGTKFHHATLRTETDPPHEFIAYLRSPMLSPDIEIFEDLNGDATLNGPEEVNNFSNAADAQAFLEWEIRKINRGEE